MTKNYISKCLAFLICLIGLTIGAQAQTDILIEDFSAMTDSNSTDISVQLDNFTNISGWTGNKVYCANGKAKVGTSSVQGYLTTPALDLSGNGGNFAISFRMKKWNNSDNSTLRIFVDETEYQVSGLTTTMTEYTLAATGGTANSKIKFSGFQSNGSRFFIDDIRIYQSTEPMLIVTPSALTFSNVEINSTVTQSITIHGQNLTAGSTLNVTIAGEGFSTTTTTLNSNDILSADGATINVNFAPTAVNDYSGTLTISGGGLADETIINLSGNGINVASVSTLAELRDLAPAFTGSSNAGTTIYKYNGEAIVTHKQSYNNVKYIQDETAAIMIYDPSGKLSSGVNIGTKITNIMGTLSNYFGMIEFVPTADVTQISPFNSYDYTVATLDQFDANHANELQAKVVKVEGVQFATPGTFATGSYYGLIQNGVTYDSIVYTDNYSADYISTAMPTYNVDILGICLYKGSNTIPNKNRIVILNNENNGMVSIDDYNTSLVSLSPNPADNYVNIVMLSAMDLNIYSITGALVAQEKLHEGNNTISISDLKSGIYILKFSDKSGNTRNAKLIVK